MKKYTKKFLFVIFIFSLGFIVSSLINKSNNIYEEQEQKQIKKHVDTISMMLETEANSGNYEMTTRESWPTEGYVFNSELSKCENGGELSWDDANKKVLMLGNTSDKCYVYFDKVLTLSTYVKSQYTGVQGENSIYYHNGTIASDDGTIIDANDSSYRYAGASENVNNFVCFGSDVIPCPTDNLYRIIGVFGDKVKLIKYDYANSNLFGIDGDSSSSTFSKSSYSTYKGELTTINRYYWNYKAINSATNTWSTSLLNKTNLNTNYLNNIGTTWANMIENTTWKVSGNTSFDVIPSVMYTAEITNATKTYELNDETSKVGLMYASDYGFAAAPSAWTTALGNYDNLLVTAVNWMYMGLTEWTISPYIHGISNDIFILNNSGFLYITSASTAFVARPVLYLKTSVVYVEGSGTQSDPIRIN